MGYLCLNKPNKVKKLLSEHVELIKEMKMLNKKSNSRLERFKYDINEIKHGLEMYGKSADYGHKFALKQANEHWNNNIFCCKEIFGTRKYIEFYDNLLNNNNFW